MKYPWSTTLGCKDIGIRKLEFVVKTEFLVVKLRQVELDRNPRFYVTHSWTGTQGSTWRTEQMINRAVNNTFSFLSCVRIDLAGILYCILLCIIVYYCVLYFYDNRTLSIYSICSRLKEKKLIKTKWLLLSHFNTEFSKLCVKKQRKWVFATNSNFLIPISLQ